MHRQDDVTLRYARNEIKLFKTGNAVKHKAAYNCMYSIITALSVLIFNTALSVCVYNQPNINPHWLLYDQKHLLLCVLVMSSAVEIQISGAM